MQAEVPCASVVSLCGKSLGLFMVACCFVWGACDAGNNIGDDGARFLAEAFKLCPQLQRVGLESKLGTFVLVPPVYAAVQ